MSEQPPPAPTARAIALALLSSKLVGRPGTESLPSTFAPPDHPLTFWNVYECMLVYTSKIKFKLKTLPTH